MNHDVALIAAAAVCIAATFALGARVARGPLTPPDAAAAALRGRLTPVGVMFTRSGYWPALLAINLCLFALDAVILGRGTFSVVLTGMQLLSQAAVNLTKDLFKRIRPDDWLHRKELGYSFPSGHATTAVVFYGGILVFIWSVPPAHALQTAASAVVGFWIAGIPWSRMALNAHYPTDVLGGLVFGAGWLCLMLLLLRHLPPAHIRV